MLILSSDDQVQQLLTFPLVRQREGLRKEALVLVSLNGVAQTVDLSRSVANEIDSRGRTGLQRVKG